MYGNLGIFFCLLVLRLTTRIGISTLIGREQVTIYIGLMVEYVHIPANGFRGHLQVAR